jgi:hypothetical protein
MVTLCFVGKRRRFGDCPSLLRKWQREDSARGVISVIHYVGKPVSFMYGSWRAPQKIAGRERDDPAHILRHTAATWFMNAGVDVAVIAGYLGMSADEVYGYHHRQFQRGPSPKLRPRNRRTESEQEEAQGAVSGWRRMAHHPTWSGTRRWAEAGAPTPVASSGLIFREQGVSIALQGCGVRQEH